LKICEHQWRRLQAWARGLSQAQKVTYPSTVKQTGQEPGESKCGNVQILKSVSNVCKLLQRISLANRSFGRRFHYGTLFFRPPGATAPQIQIPGADIGKHRNYLKSQWREFQPILITNVFGFIDFGVKGEGHSRRKHNHRRYTPSSSI